MKKKITSLHYGLWSQGTVVQVAASIPHMGPTAHGDQRLNLTYSHFLIPNLISLSPIFLSLFFSMH